MPDSTIVPTIIQYFLSDPWITFKVLFLILFILYFGFSLIVIRQVQLMTDTLQTEVSPVLRSFALLHAIVSLGIVIGMAVWMF
jgi:hypothetical protein